MRREPESTVVMDVENAYIELLPGVSDLIPTCGNKKTSRGLR